MRPISQLATACLIIAGLSAAPAAVKAETFNTCKGFIDTLPATITTQGTWCLRKDLSTAITSGNAITIATNNVTIDCNDFKIGGLAAGDGTQASGIAATGKLNATVRNCTVRGYLRGVNFVNSAGHGGGHVIEGNRFNANTYTGVRVEGAGSLVRDNMVNDTGGSTVAGFSNFGTGIETSGTVDLIGNLISGIAGNTQVFGIYSASNNGGTITDNRVRDLVSGNLQVGILSLNSSRAVLHDNFIIGPGTVGMLCSGGVGRALGNMVAGFADGTIGCSYHNSTSNDFGD